MRPALSLVALALALSTAACTGDGDGDAVVGEEDLATKAFAYTCTSPGSRILDDADTIEVAVSNGVLRFVDGFGENTGDRDRSYRAPRGKARARFEGFTYGGDCALAFVVDEGALSGKPAPQVRVQCAGDDFVQDLYTCGAARSARVRKPSPPSPPPAPVVTGPGANARGWSCTSPTGHVLEKKVQVKVDDGAMRVIAGDFDYDGVRDRAYVPRAGAFVRYDGFDYGGDCSLSAVIEPKAITPGAATAVLKVRCAGDDFVQDTYACKAD